MRWFRRRPDRIRYIVNDHSECADTARVYVAVDLIDEALYGQTLLHRDDRNDELADVLLDIRMALTDAPAPISAGRS